MKRKKILLLASIIIATNLVVAKFIYILNKHYSMPAGWKKTVITIQHIAVQETGYAYTVTYPYKIGEENKHMEQYILDDRKPVFPQTITAIYCQKEPVMFELLELIQYE